MDESISPQADSKPSSYVVLLSGTHVTGKDTLAVSLSDALNCPWIAADMAHVAATFGSRSQAKKGYDYSEVFGRIWTSKLQRLGLLVDGNEFDVKNPKKLGTQGCAAVLSLHHMRKPARDAIHEAMLAKSIRPIFVIMRITEDALSGRTLGAEEPELAKRIMEQKIADIQEPLEEEKDVILINSMRDVDSMLPEILKRINQQLEIGR